MKFIFATNFFLALLLFTGNYSVLAQRSNSADSLRNVIRSHAEDTSRVHALVDYAILMEDQHLDSAAFYYKQAGQLSDKLNYYFGKVRYAMNYSVVLNMQSRPAESRKLNQWILSLAQEKNDSLHMAKGHNNLGNSYNVAGNYDSAFSHYLKSTEIFEKINNHQHLHIIYMNIANVLHYLSQYDKAIEFGHKSIRQSKKVNDSLTLSSALINMASVFSSKHQFDSAIAIMKMALPICERTGDQYSLAAGYITLGNAYSKLQQYQKAIEAFTKSLKVSEVINYGGGMAIAYNGLAMSYFEMKSYAQADYYATKSLDLIEESNSTDLLQLYKLSADIKAHRQDFSTAYEHLLKYVDLNDSLTGFKTRQYVTELEQKYQAAEKNKQLLQNQLLLEESADKIKWKNFWLLVSVIVVLLSSALAFIYYRFYRQKQKLHQKELLSLRQQQELERLKAGLEGQQQERKRIASEMHDDLGSGLTSILFMTDGIANDANKAPENIPKIGEAAREVMSNMNEIIWSMNTENDSLEDLIAYIRHNSVELLAKMNLSYKFIVPEQIPDTIISGIQRRNIYLVVKEALHNIIKHANAEEVQICFSFSENLELEISDDGKGINKEMNNKFGNGLQNMRRRMESIGGTWCVSNNGGTHIHITLPLAV